MPVEKLCVVCGTKFNVPPVRANTAKACSHECAVIVRAKSRERKVELACAGCGRLFKVPRSHKDRYNNCSTECQQKYGTNHADVSGDKNPAWKGGRTGHSKGYVYLRRPEHPFSSNGYVLEHRAVMEKWLRAADPTSDFLIQLGDKFYLSPECVVHHVNGIRDDNRRENLLACTKHNHKGMHHNIKPEPGTYWPPTANLKE